MESFWYHRPEEDHPPAGTESPGDFQGGRRLKISLGGQDLSDYRRKKLVTEWCRVLPTLSEVRLLWLPLRVNQALFQAVCTMPGLEGLWIKHSGIRDISSLVSAPALTQFWLGSSTSLESIEPLADCPRLRGLGLENVKRISELDPLAGLSGLRELTVNGSTWTTQRVSTLSPLGNLGDLRYLSLVNLRAADRTLRPLFRLRKLQVFYAAKWWDPEELAELRSLNPSLRG